jgi:TM2 domain-containing membrane protein YozV
MLRAAMAVRRDKGVKNVMSDGFNAPGRPNDPSEQALRRPMGGFSPSSPDYRPLPPLNLPQINIPPAPAPAARPVTPPAARRAAPPIARPIAQPARPSIPLPPPTAGPPTTPGGVPTPGRVPAYPAYPAYAAYQGGPLRGYPSTPLGGQAPPPPRYRPPRYARPDSTAVVIEALGAVFGIFGLGWLMAGRTSTGILLLLGGLVWDAIFVAGFHVTFGVGACCFLPLHAIFITLSTVLLSNYIRSLP